MKIDRDENGKFIKGSKVNQGRVPSERQRQKQSEAMTGRRLSDEHKEKIRAGVLGSSKQIGRPKGGIPWNKGMRRANGDPIPPITPMTPEGRRRMIEARIKCWQNPEYRERQIKAVMKRSTPNKWELQLYSLLEKMYPGEWKFVGDGQVIIAGKCPDFININGQKKIIELYGDFWHRGDDPEERKAVFRPFGYETLVIWGSELRDVDTLKTKVFNFCK